MTDLWTARRERARAFIAQQRKPGRTWSTLTYEYDKEQDDAKNTQTPDQHGACRDAGMAPTLHTRI